MNDIKMKNARFHRTLRGVKRRHFKSQKLELQKMEQVTGNGTKGE